MTGAIAYLVADLRYVVGRLADIHATVEAPVGAGFKPARRLRRVARRIHDRVVSTGLTFEPAQFSSGRSLCRGGHVKLANTVLHGDFRTLLMPRN
jgi:hypothetical protein